MRLLTSLKTDVNARLFYVNFKNKILSDSFKKGIIVSLKTDINLLYQSSIYNIDIIFNVSNGKKFEHFLLFYLACIIFQTLNI